MFSAGGNWFSQASRMFLTECLEDKLSFRILRAWSNQVGKNIIFTPSLSQFAWCQAPNASPGAVMEGYHNSKYNSLHSSESGHSILICFNRHLEKAIASEYGLCSRVH